MLHFEWDDSKNLENQRKHGVPFDLAQHAFSDPKRVISEDLAHSASEKRFYCFGKGGAGYWRKGKRIYETENKVHK